MRCPRGDGELITRSATGLGGIPLSYHLCLACLGYWIRPFDANYLPLEVLPNDTARPEPALSFRCPTCQEPLERAEEDAMAPDILAWYCPTGHGYFFPRGNLRRFRMAQEARVTYHKLWHVPLPPLKSVLLATLVVLGAIGSAVVYSQFQKTQVQESQARQVIVFRDVILDPTTHTASIIARTSQAVSLTLHIDELGTPVLMNSPDGITHTARVGALGSGIYHYSLTFGENEKTPVRSETYTFRVP